MSSPGSGVPDPDSSAGTNPEAEGHGREQLQPDDLLNSLRQGTLSTEQQQAMAEEVTKDRPGGNETVIAQVRAESFRGPLPHPEILQQYPEDARALVLQMAQKEQEHVHTIESQRLQNAAAKDRRGQWFGLSIGLFGLFVTPIIAVFSGTAAAIIGAIDLLGLVAVFVAPRISAARNPVQTAEPPANS